MNEVTIRVPATTANLGPGYDCLGVALQIYNLVTVRRSGASPAHPMATAVAENYFHCAGIEPFPFSWSISGDVPSSRGLGSSVTVRLGLLHGLNALAGDRCDKDSIFRLCAELEGHPDNAAPAAYGGFTVAGGTEIARFEVGPQLRFILLIPDFEISTSAARKVLPTKLDHLDAAQSCANACRITAAFATQQYGRLRGAFDDHLHQPFRERELIPFLSNVIAAAESAGALGGFLSGSGSTICCVVEASERDASALTEKIGSAMLASTGQTGGRVVVTQADNEGALTDHG